MYIKAKLKQEHVTRKNKYVNRVPYVVDSDHPLFVNGTRLDIGYVEIALQNGYTVTIEPFDINQSNCIHPGGFHRSGLVQPNIAGKRVEYACFDCGLSRLINDTGSLPQQLPSDHLFDDCEDSNQRE